MKKILFFILLTLVSFPLISFAQYGDMMGNMMGYGMMAGGPWWMDLVGLIYLVLISFVFSLIFWLVYKWILKK